MKMTDAYQHQPQLSEIKEIKVLDCRDISGTRCYCDDDAKAELLKRISGFSYAGIHFIDSGNYHYLTLLWLEKIDKDFSLVLFDHHPDDQPPSFGDILSCGGWVLEAKEHLSHLKNVYTFGVGNEIPPEEIPDDLPLYISIDKDVLSTDFAITDWDQGEMSLDEMKNILSIIMQNHSILGLDICGDSGEMAESGACINSQTNMNLFDFLSANLYH